MAYVMFEKCCFCIGLRVACFIISYLELVGTIIVTSALAISLTRGSLVAAKVSEMSEHIDFNQISLEFAQAEIDILIMWIKVTLLVFFVLMLAFVITFVVGMHQRKRSHIFAYLVFASVLQLLELITFVIVCATYSVTSIFVIGNIIFILLHIYFLMVVRDYYVTENNPEESEVYKQ